jgi:hypothetical protein
LSAKARGGVSATGVLSARKEQLSAQEDLLIKNGKLAAAKEQLAAADEKLSKATEKALAKSGIDQKDVRAAQKDVEAAQKDVEAAQKAAVEAAQKAAEQAADLSSQVDQFFEDLLGKDVATASKRAHDFLVAFAKTKKTKDAFHVQVMELMMRCWVAKAAVKKVTLVFCYSGPAFQHSNGLSVFFPWFEEEDVLDAYGNLRFATVTHWAKFLRKYLETTRTERRNQKDHPEQPLRIGPAANSLETIVASSVPPLRSCINPKGLSSGSGSMKNPPDGFYRDKCGS